MESSGISLAPAPTALRIESQRVALACACAIGFAVSANYTNHAPVVGALAREFGFSQTLAGLLTTGIFITHAAMQVPGGHLVDRFGSRRVLIYALAWVVLGNFAIAFSGAYWQLLAWKIFTGIGTGTCFVAGARYIHEGLAGPRLHLAQGFYGGSLLLGSGFVILAVPRIALWVGWRGSFVISATVAVCAWILWTAVSPHVPSVVHARGHLRGMLLAPQLWLLGLMQMASFGLAIVVGAWIITLLVNMLQVPAAKAGMIGSFVLLLGIVIRPLGGVLLQHIGMRALLSCQFPRQCRRMLHAGGGLAFASARRGRGIVDRNRLRPALRGLVHACRVPISRPGGGRHGPGEHAGHSHDPGGCAAGGPSGGLVGKFPFELRRAGRIFAGCLRGRLSYQP